MILHLKSAASTNASWKGTLVRGDRLVFLVCWFNTYL